MFESYKALVETTCLDVAITAHLLHHRGRPTVTHILAGLSQLRYRGRTSALQQLLATANAWSARHQLPATDPLAPWQAHWLKFLPPRTTRFSPRLTSRHARARA